MFNSRLLHRLAAPATLAAAALIVAACATGPEVRADYDHSADFGKYRTYGFVSQAAASPISRPEFKSLALQTIQSAAAREMEFRGYRPSPTPDVLLDFNGKLEERIDIESTPGPMYGPGWGYGGWYGAPWGGGRDVTTRHYKVGTLVMDIIDREKRQSVYQGGVEGIVSKEMLRDPGASLTDAVARVFEGYPFVAGQSVPVAAVDSKR
ncbi:MAG TPA: DUF4136 domain-containing protein [Steroidobacteraceae bacterium]|nr:DUF4136 domain-containing protein [Steroidobacteraceae bacterium]